MHKLVLLVSLLLTVKCEAQVEPSHIYRLNDTIMFEIKKSDLEWKDDLNTEEYRVLRQCGTELPGTGKYDNFYEEGKYVCVGCGSELFISDTKYSSGSGWPSFSDVISDSNVVLLEDTSLGTKRIEVKCAQCGGHLGHVFPDGPAPTFQRYCINSASMKFIHKEEEKKK